MCGSDLTAQPTVSASPERLRRAKIMAELVAGRRGHIAGAERTSLQALRGWQSAIGVAVGLGPVDANGWGRTHRWANPPRDPDLIDRLLQAVEPLVTAADPAAAADVLDEWPQNAGILAPHANTFDRITQPSAALRPVIDELLGRHGRAHTVIQRRLVAKDGLPMDATTWGVDDIPQLVWPCALPDHLRDSTRPDQAHPASCRLDDPREDVLRRHGLDRSRDSSRVRTGQVPQLDPLLLRRQMGAED